MAEIEHVMISLPVEIAAVVKGAVETGDYASMNEVVHAALRDWAVTRQSHYESEAALKAAIAGGLADVAAGRVMELDIARIIERGRTLSASR